MRDLLVTSILMCEQQSCISVKLHLRDGRTTDVRLLEFETNGRTNTHSNNVHRDRRRHAVSTSLRLVTNRRMDSLSVRPSVS